MTRRRATPGSSGPNRRHHGDAKGYRHPHPRPAVTPGHPRAGFRPEPPSPWRGHRLHAPPGPPCRHSRPHGPLWISHDPVGGVCASWRVAETPITVVHGRGGCASAAELIARCGRRALRTAVALGDVVRARRGLYIAPGLSDEQVAAAQVRGVVSHESAALLLGLAVAVPPDRPHVTVPRHRHFVAGRVRVHWANLGPDESVDGVTTAIRTVLDCARTLPFGEALVIADSALTQGKVTRIELLSSAAAVLGRGHRAAVRVAEAADRRAESPLESLVRAMTLEAGMHAVPQARITDDAFFARVDLADIENGIVVEADSYRHHATSEGFERDCQRYDDLVLRGWLVLRLTWRQVINDPEWVKATLVAAMRLGRARRARSRRRPVPMAHAA